MTPSVRRRLHAARELLELRLLGAALDAASTALHLEHPTVDALAEPDELPTLLYARLLLARIRSHPLARIRSLRGALRAYRSAVHRVLEEPDREDLPF